jgi:tetratricopeptide (TPR) repeat protein
VAAIVLKPGAFPAHVNLAELYLAQNDLERADVALAEALKLDLPKAVATRCQVDRSRNLYAGKQFADALAAADAALRISPQDAQAHQRRGFALAALERPQEAIASLQEFVKQGGKPGQDFFRARGSVRMRSGDYLLAKDDYTDALKIDPQPELFVHRGWAYFFADAWKPALRDFDEAIRLDSHCGDAHTGRGLARAMLGQASAAAADAAEALRHRPRTPEMMHNIACTFAQAAKHADAPAAADQWRDQALEAIDQTLAMIPAADRPAFWRNKICPDAALNPVRDHVAFKKLEDRYKKP